MHTEIPCLTPATATRCLVLLDAQPQTADPLIRALSNRGVQVHLVATPPAVMASLAHQPADVLIVCSPDRVAWLPQLLSAVRRYYPTVRCWQYAADASAAFQLTPIARPVPPSADRPASLWGLDATRPPSAPPRLNPPSAPPSVEPLEPLLSSEEIDMLLGASTESP
jgi:hypothetical protein